MRTTRRQWCAVGASALLALTTLGLAGPAEAAPVGCGTTITQNTTLTVDVGPCSRGGITVGADNITLDLGGHRVFGKDNRTGDGVGVLLQGRTGVTVRNGTVSQFDAGIAITGGSNNTVVSVTANYNVGSTKGDFGDGIAISSSSGNSILVNNVTNNGPYDGIGLFGASTGNVLAGNLVASNAVPGSADDGIRIEGPGAANNIVRANTVSGNALDGIAVFGTGGNTGNLIEENTVTANGFGLLAARPGDGIRLFARANANIVQNNQVHDNAGNGIVAGYVTLSTGPVGATGNQFRTNDARNNVRAGRANTYDLLDQNPACDSNLWSGNLFETAFPPCTAT